MTLTEVYDTIVVGGGMAGLYAAYLLQETHKQKVLVLEAKDRIGGRIYATDVKCANGTDKWDLGGQWHYYICERSGVGVFSDNLPNLDQLKIHQARARIVLYSGTQIGITGKHGMFGVFYHQTQVHLLKVLADFNVEGYDQFTTGTKKLILRDFSDIRSYAGLIPSLGPLELLEMNSMIKKIDKLCDTIDLEKIATHPNAVEWDSITLHSYMNDNCRFHSTKEMLETAVRVVFGVDLANISLLYFLYYCKQGGSFETLLDAKNGGAQEIRVKGTMFSLCEKIANKLQNVLVDEPVTQIDQTDDQNVTILTKNGKAFRSKHMIIAIAPHLVNNIEFLPNLPNDRVRLGEAMPPSHYIKFISTYQKAFWKEKGMSGEVTCTSLPCATGPITVTFDGTTSNENPAIIGFICAEHAMYWTTKSMEERKEAVLETLAATLGNEALHAIDYVDKDWSREPYNGGCPVYVMKPRTLLYYHHALKQQFGRIHWAGTETARAWTGYIDGAIESSLRSVSEVVNGKSLPLTMWNISPAFENFGKFNSRFERKSSSATWQVVKTVIGAAAVGYIGYLVATKYMWSKE